MIERYPGGLPEVPPAVAAALKGIHPGLYLIRSRYALDQTTGEIRHDALKKPIEKPRYWVCIDHRGKKSLLFPVETPCTCEPRCEARGPNCTGGEYMPCDRRVVERVGTDLGIATETIEGMWAVLQAAEEKKEADRQESERERFRRWIENNKGAWRSAMENYQRGIIAAPKAARMRDPVIYGYDGQAVRSSRHGTVPMSGRDLGLDTPEG